MLPMQHCRIRFDCVKYAAEGAERHDDKDEDPWFHIGCLMLIFRVYADCFDEATGEHGVDADGCAGAPPLQRHLLDLRM